MVELEYRIFSLMLVILYLPHSLSTTTTTDITALKAFKASINPQTIPPYSCLGSWNFTSDPCTTPKTIHFICGLTCDDSLPSRVSSITLDSVGYSGSLTPLISQLTRLVVIDLGQNNFHGNIPLSLSKLTLLQTLSLRSNYFSGPFPSSITTLTSLQDLDLSSNLLTGPLPKSLSSLSHLTRVDLSFNKFIGNIPKLPPTLVELAIKANKLSGQITQYSFTNSAQLETVELSSNSFTGVLQPWFFQLPSLQQVNLSNNTLTRVEISKPDRIASSSLVAVDLGYNKIEGYLSVNFTEYPALASLSLRYNRLRGPIPLEYGKKGTLRRIYLDGNYLSGTPPPGFFATKESEVAGSFGDNCLKGCPPKSSLCLPSQKPMSVCKQAYSGKRP